MAKLKEFMEKHADLQKTPEQKMGVLKDYHNILKWVQVPKLILKQINLKKKPGIYVITLSKKLLRYVVEITEKSPKKFRFTFVSRMQNYAIDVLENLFKASQYRRDVLEPARLRNEHQREAYTKLRLLSYISLLAKENMCILEKHYINIIKQVDETMNYLLLWMHNKTD